MVVKGFGFGRENLCARVRSLKRQAHLFCVKVVGRYFAGELLIFCGQLTTDHEIGPMSSGGLYDIYL